MSSKPDAHGNLAESVHVHVSDDEDAPPAAESVAAHPTRAPPLAAAVYVGEGHASASARDVGAGWRCSFATTRAVTCAGASLAPQQSDELLHDGPPSLDTGSASHAAGDRLYVATASARTGGSRAGVGS